MNDTGSQPTGTDAERRWRLPAGRLVENPQESSSSPKTQGQAHYTRLGAREAEDVAPVFLMAPDWLRSV